MRVGVLDSGVGGLSILRELIQQFPYLDFVYIADYAYAPYSEKTHGLLQERAVTLVTTLKETYKCQLVVFACNTLTVTSIGHARLAHPGFPIIGTVPPVKVAADTLPVGSSAVVLSTKNTAASPYLHQLVQLFSTDVRYYLEGSTLLVKAIEENDMNRIKTELQRMLKPYRDHTNAVIIGCTHFSFVKDVMQELLSPEVAIFEPQAGIAARMSTLLASTHSAAQRGTITLVSTNPEKQAHLESFYLRVA